MKSDNQKKPVMVAKVNNTVYWIIGTVVFFVLAAVAIYLGTKNVDGQFGDILSKKPPKPIPTINIATKKPDSEAHPPEPMETVPPQPKPTKVEPSAVPDEGTTEDSYLLPTSDSQKLTKADLLDFSDLDLKKIRNEIYARHGRAFVSQDMACYFAKQSWYQINPNYSEKLLSSLEISNAVFVLNYEKERQSPLVNKDNGCVE
jgi:hypothetical protein